MQKKTVYKILTPIFLLLTLIIIIQKVSIYGCCTCPPEGYRFGFISWALIMNRYIAPNMLCSDCREFGCAVSNFIIPIETIILSLVGTYKLLRKKNEGPEQHD